MMTPEVLEHVIIEHDAQLKRLRENMHNVNNILSVVSDGLENIQENLGKSLDGIRDKLFEFSERIRTLEIKHDLEDTMEKELKPLREDLSNRNIKKGIANQIASYWWLYLIVLFGFGDLIAHAFSMNLSIIRIEKFVSNFWSVFGTYGGHRS